jgi:hypothetical protein
VLLHSVAKRDGLNMVGNSGMNPSTCGVNESSHSSGRLLHISSYRTFFALVLASFTSPPLTKVAVLCHPQLALDPLLPSQGCRDAGGRRIGVLVMAEAGYG